MRKLLTGALALMMVASMVGCGNRDVASDIPAATVGVDFIHDDPKPTTEATTVVVGNWATLSRDTEDATKSQGAEGESKNGETKKAESGTKAEATKESATKEPTNNENPIKVPIASSKVDGGNATYYKVPVSQLKGKTLKSALDAGYEINGYTADSNSFTIYLDSPNISSDVKALLNNVSGKTVAQLREMYNFKINHLSFNGMELYYANIGSVQFSFEVEGIKAVMEAHKDDNFLGVHLEETQELQNKKIKNVELSYFIYEATVERQYYDAMMEADYFDRDDKLESMAGEIILKQVHYICPE